MKAYRIAWWIFAGLVGALGVLMAATWPLAGVVVLTVPAALTGGVAAMVVLDNPGADLAPRRRRRVVTVSAMLSAAGTVAFLGLATLLGAPTAVLLAALVVGGSPAVAAYCLRKLRERGHLSGRESSRPEEPGPKSPPRIALELLDERALCLAWRVSFSALQRAGTAEQRLRIVDERRAYLDEIERRTASGLVAWLASGPRAAGDPSRFVLGDGAAGGASIDWDALLHDTDK